MKKTLLLILVAIGFGLNSLAQCGGAFFTPAVKITPDRSIICDGTPVTFTTTTYNGGSTPLYEWFINNISQGMPSGDATFTTSALSPINNSVRVTLTNNAACASPAQVTSNTIVITVNPKPIITSAVTSTICSGVTQNYKITSDMSSTYTWSRATVTGITNAAVAGQVNNLISEALVNTTSSAIDVLYSIVPTSTTGSCAGSTFTYTVTVNPLPKVQMPVEPNIVCSGMMHTYTITSDIGATYNWTRAAVNNITPSTGSGTSVLIQETLANTTIGTASPTDITVNYVITATSTTGSCVGSAITYPLTVAVATVPTVAVLANKAGICAGIPVTFTATGTATGTSPTYQWYQSSASNPAGIPVGTNTASYTATDLASSSDKVWVVMTSNAPCIAVGSANAVTSSPVAIDVHRMPAPTIVETDQTICTGESILLNIDNISSPGSVLQWQFNGTNIPNATNLNYAATEAGSYYVTENNGYCTVTSMNFVLTLDACSDFSSSINGPATVTPGQQNVAYSVTNQSGFAYVWNVTGGTIASGQNTNAITVNWDGGNASATARTSATQQQVSVTATKQSSGLSKTTSMDINATTTAVTTSLAQSGIQFYPNPSADAFNIVMPQSGTLVNYTITDLSGTAVASGTFTSTGGAEKITTNFNTGLYQVVLKYNETVTCLRLNKVQ